MDIYARGMTHVGVVRAENEDDYVVHIPKRRTPEAEYGMLFAVADGVSGQGNGKVASQTAIHTLKQSYFDSTLQEDDLHKRLNMAISAANNAVTLAGNKFDKPIATTLAGIVITPNEQLLIFSIGDSRVYRVRKQILEQLTQDDVPTTADAQESPTAITNYLGNLSLPDKPIETGYTVLKGDTFIICSDGVWSLLDEQGNLSEIFLYTAQQTPRQASRSLINQALKLGAPDNVTAIVLRTDKQPVNWLMVGTALLVAVVFTSSLIFAAVGVGTLAVQSPPTAGVVLLPSSTAAEPLTPTLAIISTTPSTSAQPAPSFSLTPTLRFRATQNNPDVRNTGDAELATQTGFYLEATQGATSPAQFTPAAQLCAIPSHNGYLAPSPLDNLSALNSTERESYENVFLQLAQSDGVILQQLVTLYLDENFKTTERLYPGTRLQVTPTDVIIRDNKEAFIQIHIEEDGQEGWIERALLLSLNTVKTVHPYAIIVNEDGANICLEDDHILRTLQLGDKVRVIGRSIVESSWYHVEAPDGQQGWMISDFIIITADVSMLQTRALPPQSASAKDKSRVRTDELLTRTATP
jgi:serine/threonine protein phosphatase PrpC